MDTPPEYRRSDAHSLGLLTGTDKQLSLEPSQLLADAVGCGDLGMVIDRLAVG